MGAPIGRLRGSLRIRDCRGLWRQDRPLWISGCPWPFEQTEGLEDRNRRNSPGGNVYPQVYWGGWEGPGEGLRWELGPDSLGDLPEGESLALG